LNIFRAKPEEIKIDNQYYKNAYQGISRQVLTSGVSQVVPDESEFAMQLKLILKGNNNKIIDPLMIYNDLRKGVTKTTPLFGNLAATGHQEGASFLLFKKSDSVNLIEEKKQETKKITMTEEEKAKEYGSVKIEVKENGKLYIDNEFIGEIKSDKLVTLNNILTGRHIIKIDYQDKVETQDINIEKGAVKSINFIYVRQKEKSLLIDNKVITNVMKKEFEYKNKNFIENFDKIKVGLSPRDWYNIYSEPGLYYEVVDSKTINPHSFPNCLKLYDNSEIKAVKIRKDIGDHNYGQVKFYFYIQDIKNIFFFSLKDVHSKNLFMVFIGRDNGSIDILINNGNYKAIGSFKYYNEWNEFVIKYDRISGYYNLICNGINYGIYELNIDQKPYLIEFQGGVVKATFSNIELQNGTVLSYPYKLKKNITVFIDDIEFTTYKETIKF